MSMVARRRWPLIAVLLGLIVTASRAGEAIWFDDISADHDLSEQDQQAAAKFAADRLLGKKGDAPDPIRRDSAPRIVFLSASDGATPARVHLGRGSGIIAAVEDAAAQLAKDAKPKWITVDLVESCQPLGEVRPDQALGISSGFEGIAFDEASGGAAFLPAELTAHSLVARDRINWAAMQTYAPQRQLPPAWAKQARSASKQQMFRFRANGFFIEEGKAVPLIRGHRIFPRVNKMILRDAAARAADYLVRSVRQDGSFIYEYDPQQNSEAAEYNMLRHAGAIYAMYECAQLSEDPRLLEAAKRALGYMLGKIHPLKSAGEPMAALVNEDGNIKLGGNGLALIALAQHAQVTGDRQHLPLMASLARWILSIQEPSGEYGVHAMTFPDGPSLPITSAYYPGEAMLGLMRLHALDPRDAWLDSADKAATWIITQRDGKLTDRQQSHDHWLLYALSELYEFKPREIYLKHMSRISRLIVDSQIRVPLEPDWLGGYGRPPGSNPTATRTEGLCAAYPLVQQFGEAELAERMLQSIDLGARFQLQTQLGPESVMYFEDPRRALGAFHETLSDRDVRIDHVQHNISALLGAARALESLPLPVR